MSRPSVLVKDKVLYWTIRLYNDSQALVDADSTPTVAVRKNGASVGDSVTVTKRAATTGIYDCSYNPAGEVEGDQYTLEESATVSSTTYENSWQVAVQDVERGTDGASTFDPTTDAVANVTTVQTTVSNTDMRGTDGANTVAPDNAGIASNGSAIAALNDFDPANDAVANVTLVATCTTNTDMRGTDGANTVAPDNAGISANGTAISNLNDFDPATDTVANVTTVQTTVSNTDMRGTDNALLAASAPANFDILFINGSGQVDATGGGGGSAPTEAEIYTYFTSASREDAFKADTTGLSTFDSTTDQVVASNMRGTDNALLAASAPTNWSIMLVNGSGEITTSNPAAGGGSAHTAEDVRDLILAGDKTPIAVTTGSVDNVILVDTTTANTDMRGTDSALLAAGAPTNFDIMSINGSGQVDATGSGGSAPSEADIYTYFTSVGREDVFKADTTGLSTFDSTTDQVVASNMRGTDGANTVAPDNAGIAANGVAIAALNDFDPASDTVAHVTLVDTTTDLTNQNATGPTAQEIVDTWGNQPQGTYVTPDTLGFYLDAQVSTAGSGGTGLYQLTVLVQDTSANALQGARVNIDGTTLTLTTDSSGEVVFNLDSGIYTLDVSPPAGYETPISNIVTINTSDTSSTFTLAATSDGGGGDCDVPWL